MFFPSPQYTGRERRKEVNAAMVVLRNSTIEIRDARDVARVFQDLFRLEDAIDQDKEHFYVMHMNARQKVNLVELVSVGILNEAPFHPRETFRRAVIEGSYSIIVAHNHPTGEVTPSDGDIRTTRKLHEAGELLQIPLLDHIIFTAKNGQFFSFKDNTTHSSRQTQGELRKDPLCQYQIAKRINAP
jgi:DNA repair protein RadC